MTFLLRISARNLALGLLVFPLGLYSAYLAFIASERYVSESVIAVRQASGDVASALPGAAMLLAGLTPPAQEDTLYLKEFVRSRALIDILDKRLELRKHYSSSRADLPFKLSSTASLEDFIDFYRSRVEVRFDDRSALLTLRVQAFNPAYAQRLNAAILEESERFVNESSHRMARERLRFAEGELDSVTKRLQLARNQLLAFQNKHHMLDATAQVQAAAMLTAELQAARSRLETEVNGMLAFLNEDAYQVKALRARISALDRQIESERSRATTDPRKGERLNDLAIEFQGLQLQAEFGKEAYKLALGAVENARIDATRKIKSLLVVEPSSLPETAEYPARAYNLATLLAICALLFAITRLVLATVREHQD